MNLFGTIAGAIVLLTCVGMVIVAIIKEYRIRKHLGKSSILGIRHIFLCAGIFCNIILGASVLELSLSPSSSLPHDMFAVPLFMTPLGYILFWCYFVHARRLVKRTN